MISYLSRPIQPGVIPEQAPIELIAQVAQQKQVKYDTMLTAIMGQYENLLSLDASSNALQQNRYNEKMTEANKNIASLAKLDLMNPDNASKIENVFAPILNDTKIMTAVSEAQRTRKEQAIWDNLKLKGSPLYSAENERFWKMKKLENYNMGEEFITERNTDGVVMYKDLHAKIEKQLKALPTVENVVQRTDGEWIVKLKDGGSRPLDTMLDYINLDADDLAQARINAWSSAPSTKASYYIEETYRSLDKTKKAYGSVITTEKAEIEIAKTRLNSLSNEGNDDRPLTSTEVEKYKKDWGIIKLTTGHTIGDLKEYLQQLQEEKEKAVLQNQEKVAAINNNLGRFQTHYGVNYDPQNDVFQYSREFEDKELDELRTQHYVMGLKESMAKAHFYQTKELTIEADPYGKLKMDYELDLNKRFVDAQIEMAKYDAGITSSKTKTGKGDDEESPGDPSLVQLTTTSGTPLPYSRQQFNAEKNLIQVNKAKVYNDYVGEYARKQSNNLNANPEEFKTAAGQRYQLVETALKQGKNTEGKYVIGNTTISEQDFKNQYGDEINAITAVQNLETTERLYSEIESAIEASIPKTRLPDQQVSDLLRTKKISTVGYTEPVSKDSIPQAFSYDYYLPISIVNKISKNPNNFTFSEDDLYAIYKHNQDVIAKSTDRPTGRPKIEPSFENFKNNFINNGYFIDNVKIKPPDRITKIDEQYKKLAETQIPKAFAIIPGTDLHTAVQAQLIGEQVLNGAFAEQSKLQFVLEVDNTIETGYRIKAINENNESTTPFALSKSTLDSFEDELQQIKGISEIDNILLLMRRRELAKTNPAYREASTPSKAETIYYGGETFQVMPDPGGQTVTLLWQSAPINPNTGKMDFEKNRIANLNYLGNKGVSAAILNIFPGANSKSVKINQYLTNVSTIINNAKKAVQ